MGKYISNVVKSCAETFPWFWVELARSLGADQLRDWGFESLAMSTYPNFLLRKNLHSDEPFSLLDLLFCPAHEIIPGC